MHGGPKPGPVAANLTRDKAIGHATVMGLKSRLVAPRPENEHPATVRTLEAVATDWLRAYGFRPNGQPIVQRPKVIRTAPAKPPGIKGPKPVKPASSAPADRKVAQRRQAAIENRRIAEQRQQWERLRAARIASGQGKWYRLGTAFQPRPK